MICFLIPAFLPHDVREEDIAVLLVASLEELLLVAGHLEEEAHAHRRTP